MRLFRLRFVRGFLDLIAPAVRRRLSRRRKPRRRQGARVRLLLGGVWVSVAGAGQCFGWSHIRDSARKPCLAPDGPSVHVEYHHQFLMDQNADRSGRRAASINLPTTATAWHWSAHLEILDDATRVQNNRTVVWRRHVGILPGDCEVFLLNIATPFLLN